ncbi:Periplasmic beta-glucosidase [Lasiodiplodia hormozganensis]|uniref:xylan 1,4-beta-xylosidase n=1 Tax=Lasiodiplodia hormozganensis TaxID=869390 RepID=A0AA40CIF6_9PEZI|nr:Periplasmic beta-glucosidase [Lasiodiplodia hormozganensis]
MRLVALSVLVTAGFHLAPGVAAQNQTAGKDDFIDGLLAQMTVPDLDKSRLKIPFLHFGECLHGVGSYKQSMFPQSLGMAASFDTDLVYRVGRAIGTEARSIGIHACLSPVLDLGKDPRFGRAQEAWGEDKVLTSHMGVAYASGLSKNGSWSDPDAVAPVMKHFAAYGAPQGGLNAAPWMGHGNREIREELLMPFKAAVELGGVRGVMMSYNELDDVPAHVHPMLYGALEEWGYDGFVMADDTGMIMLQGRHKVASSAADAIQQWFNAGGMIQFYDYSLETYLNTTIDLVENGTVPLSTLQAHVRKILGVKYDLGLFSDAYISSDIDPQAVVDSHVPLTVEAAQKSLVLLENRNSTLPLRPAEQNIKKIALIGPFGDMLNYGDYSGTYGSSPVANSSTIQQAMQDYLSSLNSTSPVELVTSWGANTWLYNAQYPIPGYHLSPLPSNETDQTIEGLLATYFAGVDFTSPLAQRVEVPVMDWGLYPPPGLESNNFSATWEGYLTVPPSLAAAVDGWLGVAVSPNTTAALYVDGVLVSQSPLTTAGNFLSNIPPRTYSQANSTAPPPGSAPFEFVPGAKHRVRIEYVAYNLYQKIENLSSVNAQIMLFWNLVNRGANATTDTISDTASDTAAISHALAAASVADAILLALGANWNSDGEGGDRASLTLAPNQTRLASAVLEHAASSVPRKPVVLILQGGRPFAIPSIYARSDAVLAAFFPGQGGGQAIVETLFAVGSGASGPGGRVPLSVPRDVGVLPAYYNYKQTAHAVTYLDAEQYPAAYPFGWGLGYSIFSVSSFAVDGGDTFSDGGTLTFRAGVTNDGTLMGSYVAQVYLLRRVSSITQPERQLVAFARADGVAVGESRDVVLAVDVDRYLRILNRKYNWELERGDYTFALMAHGSPTASTEVNVTVVCV